MITITRIFCAPALAGAVATLSTPAAAAAPTTDPVAVEITEHAGRSKSSLTFVVVVGGSVSGWTTLGNERVHCRASVHEDDGAALRVDVRCGPNVHRLEQDLKVHAVVALKGRRPVVVGEVPGENGTRTVVRARRS